MNTPNAKRDTIRINAHFNGDFLRDSVSREAAEAATARTVSVLITLREIARKGNLSAADVQAAIDGFMDGARMITDLSPMGAEQYRAQD